MTTINVVDSIMGAGKTSWAIQCMRERAGEKFLYVTPYLNECERIAASCGPERFSQPHDKDGQTKLDDLKACMAEGKSVATTHELFKRIDNEVLEHVADHGYILILDEVIEVIRPVAPEKLDPDAEQMKYADWVQAMLDREVLVKGEANKDGSAVKLLPGPEARLGFAHIRQFAAEGRLVMVSGAMLVWLFPADCFQAFKEVYNLTYLFDGQAQKAYFEIHGLPFTPLSVAKVGDRYELVPYDSRLDREVIERAKELINIYEGPANEIGTKTGRAQPLSKTWYLKNRKLGGQVMTAAANWLKRSVGAAGSQAIWTVFKPIFGKGRVCPNGFKKSWVSVTTRSTNAYRDRRAVAYLANVFFRVPVARYLSAAGITLNEDLFALSEMIQLIWRSRIRQGEPIDLFVPSERMRGLLKDWLALNHEESVKTLPYEAEAV